MDTFTLNKIAGAVLGTLTVLLGVNAIVDEVFHQKKPEKPGYEVAGKQESGGGKEAAGGGGGVAAMLASADPAKGESISKRCAACHSFGKGEPAKVGPNLYGVVGAKHAHMEGFNYSDAMKKSGGEWDFASLDKWIENPKGYIQGTSMSFAGIKAPEERASLIAYLNKNSDSPKPLPKGGEGGAKPAAGGGGAPAAGGGFEAKVASADPSKGESISKRCAACHSFKKGEPAKAGPNLYGVVGAKHAHMEGFGYSDAMKKSGGEWDVATLDKWIENPKGYIQGTSMSFAGIKSEDERAALIAYLNKNSDNPKQLGGGGGDKKAEAAAPPPAAEAEKKPEGDDASHKTATKKTGPENEQGGGSGVDKKEQPAPAPAPAAPPPAPAGGEKKAGAAPPAPSPADQQAPKPANEQAGGNQEAAKSTEPAKPAEGAKPEAEAPAPATDGAKPEAPAPAPAAGGAEPIDKRLASADAAKGEEAAAQCQACHTFKKGEPAGAGPNLYGVVGQKHGHMEGFEYSDGMKSKQGDWDFAQLDEWLTSPEKYIPGTTMAFPGVEDPQERANIIAYLSKNSDNPQPLPGAK